MGFKILTVLLPALLLLRGSDGEITLHYPEWDACALQKYKGGDGTVDISKLDQKFAQYFRFFLRGLASLWVTLAIMI